MVATQKTDTVSKEELEKKEGDGLDGAPFNLIWQGASKSGGQHYIVETPPQHFRMRIGYTGYSPGFVEYQVPFPWLYFVIELKKGTPPNRYYKTGLPGTSRVSTVMGRTQRFTNPDRCKFYYVPMPNWYPGSRTFCKNLGVNSGDNLAQRLNNAISAFWGGDFTYFNLTVGKKMINTLEDLSGTQLAKGRHRYTYADYKWPQEFYKWMSKQSLTSIKKMPWGRDICFGKLNDVTTHRFFGYDGYLNGQMWT